MSSQCRNVKTYGMLKALADSECSLIDGDFGESGPSLIGLFHLLECKPSDERTAPETHAWWNCSWLVEGSWGIPESIFSSPPMNSLLTVSPLPTNPLASASGAGNLLSLNGAVHQPTSYGLQPNSRVRPSWCFSPGPFRPCCCGVSSSACSRPLAYVRGVRGDVGRTKREDAQDAHLHACFSLR